MKEGRRGRRPAGQGARPTLCLLLLALTAQAAVDGHVVNMTTGKPQAGSLVTLYSVGAGGPQPVKAVPSDASGAFHFDATVQGPHLLQAIYGGVVYSQMLTPGSPVSNIQIPVYDSEAEPGKARVSQHMVLVEPISGIYHVNESVIFENDGNKTYNDPSRGTLRLYLPTGIEGQPRLEVTPPQGMPVERPLESTSDPHVYKSDYAIRPGETRFDVTYVLPAPESGRLQGEALHSGAPIRLVAPSGVTFTGDMITLIGQEPTTHADVYEVKGDKYDIGIEGTGQLSRAAADENAQPQGGSDLQRVEARVYDHVYMILGLALLILLAGFIFLYRRGEAG